MDRAPQGTGSTHVKARAAAVEAKLESCMEELDELGLSMSGAHLSMAIETIMREAASLFPPNR